MTDTILEKGLPVSLDSERFVLGSILLDGALFGEIAGILQPEDFAIEKHRRIFLRMAALQDRGERIDRVTVFNELLKHNEAETCDGLTYLVSLDDGLPRISNADAYARIVNEKALLRRLIFASQKLIDRCMCESEPVQEILEGARETFGTLSPAEQSQGWSRIGDVIATTGVDALLSGRREHGIPLPWPAMDQLLAGLHREQLITLAGAPSAGKTSAALQIASCSAHVGIGVAVFNLEMSKRSLVRRLIHQRAHSDRDTTRLRGAVADASVWPIYLDDRVSSTPAMIHAAVRRLRLKHEIGLVIVDFLQILGTRGRSESRNVEVGANSRALKLMAKEFGLPVLMLSSLSRDPSKDDREPKLSDLRDSGEIEFNSDVVMFVHRRKGGSDSLKPARFIVAKQREGPRDVWVDMVFRPECQRFDEEIDPEPSELWGAR